ncbi:MAG: hypothetical protein WBG86_11930 [Polyangiales bacterium]
MFLLAGGGYQSHCAIGEIFVFHARTDFGRKPDVAMGQSAESVEEYLCASPGRRRRGYDQHTLAIDSAETAIDMCLLRQLFLDEANAEPTDGALERLHLTRDVHRPRVGSPKACRNLVDV